MLTKCGLMLFFAVLVFGLWSLAFVRLSKNAMHLLKFLGKNQRPKTKDQNEDVPIDLTLSASAEMHQPPLQCGGRSLSSVSHPKLAKDIVYVTLYRRFANAQTGPYLFVTLPSDYQFQHFHLSAG